MLLKRMTKATKHIVRGLDILSAKVLASGAGFST
jgi:hypothetical protein